MRRKYLLALCVACTVSCSTGIQQGRLQSCEDAETTVRLVELCGPSARSEDVTVASLFSNRWTNVYAVVLDARLARDRTVRIDKVPLGVHTPYDLTEDKKCAGLNQSNLSWSPSGRYVYFGRPKDAARANQVSEVVSATMKDAEDLGARCTYFYPFHFSEFARDMGNMLRKKVDVSAILQRDRRGWVQGCQIDYPMRMDDQCWLYVALSALVVFEKDGKIVFEPDPSAPEEVNYPTNMCAAIYITATNGKRNGVRDVK